MKNNKLIRIIGFVLLGGAILYGLSFIGDDPKPSWNPTWSGKDTNPFGTELLKLAVKDFVAPAEFIVADNSPDLILEEYYDFEPSAYLFVNQKFDPDFFEWMELQDFAEDGNMIWVAAESVSDLVSSSLETRVSPPFLATDGTDSVKIYFNRPGWSDEAYSIPLPYLSRLRQNDTSFVSAEPLMVSYDGSQVAAFYPIGAGGVFLSTFPKVISNYGLLDPDYEQLIAGLLSVIPNDVETVYWDEWIKVGNRRRQDDHEAEDGPSPLSFIWQHEALRMALLLSLGGIILMLLFQTKRTQRIIPPSPPLSNTTIDFTDTVGRLYFQHQQHRLPALKRIAAFREYLHEKYLLPENFGSEEYCRVLAAKSGKDLKQIVALIRTIHRAETATSFHEDQLHALSEQLDDFIQS